MWPNHAGLGVELLAWRPSVAVVDDGQFAVEGILCDVPERGSVVRLLTQKNAPELAEPVFLREHGGVIKLRPLDTLAQESGYKLVAFQVQ